LNAESNSQTTSQQKKDPKTALLQPLSPHKTSTTPSTVSKFFIAPSPTQATININWPHVQTKIDDLNE
jgi:hypothetical protein